MSLIRRHRCTVNALVRVVGPRSGSLGDVATARLHETTQERQPKTSSMSSM
jgi:hypothetical protein